MPSFTAVNGKLYENGGKKLPPIFLLDNLAVTVEAGNLSARSLTGIIDFSRHFLRENFNEGCGNERFVNEW